MKKVLELIKELYKTNDGSVGGYGHIVFDDGNFSDMEINFCIESAKKADFQFLSEETRLASLKALEAMILLSKKEREIVYYKFWNK